MYFSFPHFWVQNPDPSRSKSAFAPVRQCLIAVGPASPLRLWLKQGCIGVGTVGDNVPLLFMKRFIMTVSYNRASGVPHFYFLLLHTCILDMSQLYRSLAPPTDVHCQLAHLLHGSLLEPLYCVTRMLKRKGPSSQRNFLIVRIININVVPHF